MIFGVQTRADFFQNFLTLVQNTVSKVIYISYLIMVRSIVRKGLEMG